MTIGRYILRRFFLFVPTFILLLLLTIFLQENMPGDRINVRLDSSELRSGENQKTRRSQYNNSAKQMGVGDPVFYLTIAPANHSRSRRLDDHRFQVAKRSWLTKYDFRKVDRFYATLTDIMRQLNVAESSADAILYGQLSRIGEADPEQGITLISEIKDGRLEPLHDVLEQVISTPVRWNNGIPHMKWHGLKNRFHSSAVGLITGNWGLSATDGRPVRQKIGQAIRWTLVISVASLILSMMLAFILGLIASLRDHSLMERLISSTLFGIYAMPLFWIATLMIVFFTTPEYGRWFDLFPSVGVIVMDGSQSFLGSLMSRGYLLVLPILCLTISSVAYFYQFLLSGNRYEMERPYFVAARAKGLDQRSALLRHSFINATYPVIGLLAVIVPGLISGSLVLEVLFNIPGMGRLMFDSILTQDWNVVTSVVLISGVLTFYILSTDRYGLTLA